MRRLAVLLICPTVLLAGCARAGAESPNGPATPALPAGFAAGCGHPGANVVVLAVPVTIPHKACDLTGVRLTYGLATVTVPDHGRANQQVETFAATTAPTSIVVDVDPATHDVTVTG